MDSFNPFNRNSPYFFLLVQRRTIVLVDGEALSLMG
jgi:hypothetical protein